MAEPTPGPWTVQAETHVMAGSRLVAGCGGYWCNDGGEHRAENAANARLIAKARHLPELVEALKACVYATPGSMNMIEAREHGRAALALVQETE